MNTTKTDLLLAVMADRKTVYRLPAAMTWGEAQDAWTEQDDARRAGKRPHVAYYAVRSVNDPDPRWAGAKLGRRGAGAFGDPEPKLDYVKLDRARRDELVAAARAYRRQHDYGSGVDYVEVADHVFSLMLGAEDDRYNVDHLEAVEVSDYAMGIARFVAAPNERAWW